MRKEEKATVIENLVTRFNEGSTFYITDSSTLTVEEVNNLRALCYESGVEMQVAKNTLIKKAMEQSDKDFEELYDTLKGPTAIMFATVGNAPAKMLEKFRKSHDKPVLKGASIESAVFLGDDQLKALASLKSKEELVGEIIGLLQSPAKTVISGLQSGGNVLSGLIKALSERDAA